MLFDQDDDALAQAIDDDRLILIKSKLSIYTAISRIPLMRYL